MLLKKLMMMLTKIYMNDTGIRRTVQKQIKGSAQCHAITEPILVDLCIKLDALGFSVDNQQEGVIFKQKEWRIFYSKVTNELQCYYIGYGNCAVFCSLLNFNTADDIIHWSEENKHMTLIEPEPIIDRLEETRSQVIFRKR